MKNLTVPVIMHNAISLEKTEMKENIILNNLSKRLLRINRKKYTDCILQIGNIIAYPKRYALCILFALFTINVNAQTWSANKKFVADTTKKQKIETKQCWGTTKKRGKMQKKNKRKRKILLST